MVEKSKTPRSKKTGTGAAKKTASPKRPAKSTSNVVTLEERWHMIAEAAYYLAEKRGFTGDPVDDWIEAERAIDEQLGNT